MSPYSAATELGEDLGPHFWRLQGVLGPGPSETFGVGVRNSEGWKM